MCLIEMEMSSEIKRLLAQHDLFLFDVDDTLLYTFKNGFRKVNLVAAQMGLQPLPFSQYEQLYGKEGFLDCVCSWFPNADPTAFQKCYAEISQEVPYLPICRFCQIQSLFAARLQKTAILTNGKHDAKLMKKLEACQTDIHLLSGIWGEEDLPAIKPDPRAVLPVIEHFPACRIVYIGDSEIDFQMSKSAGISFLQVYTGNAPAIKGTAGIASVKELLFYLKE